MVTKYKQIDLLKQTLFRQTKEALDAFRKADTTPAESYDDYVKRETTHAAFCALYSLIEETGMEDEYQGWKENQTWKEGER